MKIFFNGLNAKTGGGKSILNNYLTVAKKNNSKHKYVVLTPDKIEYEKYGCDFIKIIDIRNGLRKSIFSPMVNGFVVPKLLKEHGADVVFNIADLIIPTDIPQLYLFDWPYAVYPDSKIWREMDFRSYLSRKVKLLFFKKNMKRATKIVAQTKTAKSRLESIYGLKNIGLIPNAICLDNLNTGSKNFFKLPSGKKFLYLSYYYPHKNFEIFIPLAKEIKKQGKDYKIIITIEASQHKRAHLFLKEVKKYSLEDVIYNVGLVDMVNVSSLYSQCDALLMPTLLESYSLSFLEAMYHKKIILTSNLDFAHDVCGESAIYFDPLSASSIIDALNFACENSEVKENKIREGTKILKNRDTWEQTFDRCESLMEEMFLPLDSHRN